MAALPGKAAGRSPLPAKARDQKKADERVPRQRKVEVKLPTPSLNVTRTRKPTPIAETGGAVGFALNGVLLVGQHYKAKKAQPTVWHFDDCGGHADENGWYHYHFPSNCFFASNGIHGPSKWNWWTMPEPSSHWAPIASESPVLGYALDGFPIYGPYGQEGRLVNTSELDSCNGKVVVLPNGREEYRYYWTVMLPFLPQCLRGKPVKLNLRASGGAVCPAAEKRSLSAPLTMFPSVVTAGRIFTTGCPDHRYFQNAVHGRRLTASGRSGCNGGSSGSCCGSTCKAGCNSCSGCASKCSSCSSCSGCSTGCCSGSCNANGCCGSCSGNCTASGCSGNCAGSCNGGGCSSSGCCGGSCCGGCSSGGSCAGCCGSGCSSGGCCAVSCNGSCSGSECKAGGCCAGSCSVGCSATGCSSGGCCAGSCSGGCSAEGCSPGGCNAGSCSGGCIAGGCSSGGGCSGSCSAGGCSPGGCDSKGCGASGPGITFALSEASLAAMKATVSSEVVAAGCDLAIIDIFNPCSGAFCGVPQDPPEVYYRYKPFTMSLALVTPPLLCQTRKVPKACDSKFISEYNQQKNNPKYNPPLNAPRNDTILRCRSDVYDDSALLGYYPIKLDGKPNYCVFLSPEILASAKQFEWIDDMTEEVSINSFLHLPAMDKGVLLTMNFGLSNSGLVQGTYHVYSYTSIKDSPIFSTILSMNIAFACLMLIRFMMVMRAYTQKTLIGKLFVFDLLVTVAFGIFVALGMQHLFTGTSTGDVLMPLVNAFLDAAETTGDEAVNAVNALMMKFHDGLTMVLDEVAWMQSTKLVAYSLSLVSIVRLVLYMSVHPRISITTDTIKKSLDDIFHFVIVFSMIFFTLAWLAHWSFGSEKELFSTFSSSLHTCFQMFLGEFELEADYQMDTVQKVWTAFFVFIVVIVCLNVLLAIVVESFISVKKAADSGNQVHLNFLVDLGMLVFRQILGVTNKWPSPQNLLRHLHCSSVLETDVTPDELMSSRFAKFQSKQQATDMLNFYLRALGDCMLGEAGRTQIEAIKKQEMFDMYLMQTFECGADEVQQLHRKASKVQAMWRAQIAMRKVERKKERRDRRVGASRTPESFVGSPSKAPGGSPERSPASSPRSGSSMRQQSAKMPNCDSAKPTNVIYLDV
eukprot:TRINITY_DN6080_c2_g2_i1.p1 TRINITY_DN6080_c2_g2~~TRINITY_DN6080_c2_g2_i1.p1  ORF type:complete len:1228 (-),score=245.12 TRINITY_DN6080_c2_g2_i1:359-3781(-)